MTAHLEVADSVTAVKRGVKPYRTKQIFALSKLLRFLYQQTDENHPVTVSDIIFYLMEKGIWVVRQTVYADLDVLIAAGIDIVMVKSTQNQYFIRSCIFEYSE